MFNVSAFLLGNALKLATPVTYGVISEKLRQFAPLSDISQGSVVTHLRCGEIFSDSINANFLLNLTVKNSKIWLKFDKVKAYNNIVPFLDHPVYTAQMKRLIRLFFAPPRIYDYKEYLHATS